MGLALECFHKIFPTTRHSIHVRRIVRKATLNGPKPFGYFWASKVTKNLFYIFLKDRGHRNRKMRKLFLYFTPKKENLQKNISPPIGVKFLAIYLIQAINKHPSWDMIFFNFAQKKAPFRVHLYFVYMMRAYAISPYSVFPV